MKKAKVRKREWIIALGATALVITLFSIGSFLVYWGVWSRLYGHGTRPVGLNDIMWASGGFIIFLGIYVASILFSYLSRKRRAEREKDSGKRMLSIGKFRGIIPRDVAIAVFNWAVFTVWIMLVSTGFIAYDPMFDPVAIVVGLALSSYTTWLGIRAYRKWRLKK